MTSKQCNCIAKQIGKDRLYQGKEEEL